MIFISEAEMSSKTNVINSQQEKTPSSDLDASAPASRKRQSGATAISSKTSSSSESETKVQPVASDKRTTKRPLAKVDATAKVKPNNRPPPPLHKPPAPGPGVTAGVGQLSDKVQIIKSF